MEVDINWLLESCTHIIGFGGLINETNLKEYVQDKTVQTSLTRRGIKDVENGTFEKKKFIAVLPGIGLADCFVQ